MKAPEIISNNSKNTHNLRHFNVRYSSSKTESRPKIWKHANAFRNLCMHMRNWAAIKEWQISTLLCIKNLTFKF